MIHISIRDSNEKETIHFVDKINKNNLIMQYIKEISTWSVYLDQVLRKFLSKLNKKICKKK